jgi:hypothetical protein
MEAFFYWSGVVLWLIVAGFVARLCYELGAALCVAVDWLRWQLAMCAEHRSPWTLGKAARAFWRRWVDFALNGYEHTSWESAHGWWRGFRDWGVHKRDA